jgi:hypothetical protein
MNERLPESSGLPLRAMVMVLLFLGVAFLLVGFQAMGSSGGPDDKSSPVVSTTTTTTKTTPALARADVRVYNIGADEGAAGRTADRLKAAGFNVTETSNLSLPDVPVTTVFFGEAPGEQAAADEVGKLLEVPVATRVPELAEQPPGVIVIVTG